MKKFFIKLTGYLLAIAVTIMTVFFAVQIPAPVTGGLVGSIRMKNKILQSTSAPRIIIAAGSSAPYCFISSEITNAFNMPCVNMGATAYLGAEFYLSVIEPEIKKGDIIILAFETNIYSGLYVGDLVWRAVDSDWSLIKKLPLSYVPKLITSYFTYATSKFSTHLTSPDLIETDEQFYTSFGFSQTGDILTPRKLILESGYNTQDLHSVNASSVNTSVTKAIKSFAKKAEKKGAQVYIIAAPINELSLHDDTDFAAFQSRISAETDVQILGDMQNSAMKGDYFFDSNFHLNSKGAELYTQSFIKELTKIINK